MCLSATVIQMAVDQMLLNQDFFFNLKYRGNREYTLHKNCYLSTIIIHWDNLTFHPKIVADGQMRFELMNSNQNSQFFFKKNTCGISLITDIFLFAQ